MNKFDIFVNGIQTSHFDKKEQVIIQASSVLKIPKPLVEKLLNTPSTRIRQGISEKKALQYHHILNELGIVCFYSPVAQETKNFEDSVILSTSNIENSPTYTCPNCSHKIETKESEAFPEVCDECGIFIDLYLKYKVQDDESPTLFGTPSKTIQQNKQANTYQKDNTANSKIQNQDIQPGILSQQTKREDKDNTRPIILMGVSLVLFSLAAILYPFFSQQYEASKTTITSDKNQQSIPSIDNKIITSHPSKSIDQNSNLALNHKNNKINQVESPTLKSDAPQPQLTSTDSKTNKILGGNSSNLKPSSLFHKALDNQEWDNFLSQKINTSITKGSPEQSLDLISCLSNPKKHINSLAKLLLASTNKDFKKGVLSKMDGVIKTYPIEERPHLLIQAGRYQINPAIKNELLNRAENNWRTLSNPEKKLKSALKMATAYFEGGNVKATNQYLMEITQLLPQIDPENVTSQIKLRIAISRANKDTGNLNYALEWIKDSEALIEKIGEPALKDFVIGYAYLNQYPSVLRLIKRASSVTQQDKLFYSAIKVYLASEQIETAVKLNRSIQGASYKALSYILIANYSKAYQGYAVLAESALNIEITSPFNKAIISSRLAQLYARQYHIYKTEKQLKITEQQIKLIPASPEKDHLLSIVAINYARSLMFKPATTFASAIQSPEISSFFFNEYKKLSKITAL